MSILNKIIYIPNFIDNPDDVFKKLDTELDFVQKPNTPRMEYYSNDTDYNYIYPGFPDNKIYTPQPWHKLMYEIRDKLESVVLETMDVCFINYYKGQFDHLGWHADDSPTMDTKRPIVTISLGTEREIWFKAKPDVARANGYTDKEVLKLGHGSACIMPAHFQESFLHRIPKNDRPCPARMSLTFRGFVSPE